MSKNICCNHSPRAVPPPAPPETFGSRLQLSLLAGLLYGLYGLGWLATVVTGEQLDQKRQQWRRLH